MSKQFNFTGKFLALAKFDNLSSDTVVKDMYCDSIAMAVRKQLLAAGYEDTYVSKYVPARGYSEIAQFISNNLPDYDNNGCYDANALLDQLSYCIHYIGEYFTEAVDMAAIQKYVIRMMRDRIKANLNELAECCKYVQNTTNDVKQIVKLCDEMLEYAKVLDAYDNAA